MSWEPRWVAPARRALNQLARRDAEVIDAAVQRFARGEGGDAYQLASDQRTLFRLRVGDYRVRMLADPASDVLWIVMVYRADR